MNIYIEKIECSSDKEGKKEAFKNIKNSMLRTAYTDYINSRSGKNPIHEEDVSIPDIQIREGGKPYIKDCPDFQFNFSDSGDYVVLAVSKQEVGIDIQKQKEISSGIENVAKKFYTEKESNFICELDSEYAADFFFRLWVIKEAFIKYTGRGLSQRMNTFDIQQDRLSPGCGTIIDSSTGDTLASWLEITPPESGYYMAVCTKCEQ